MNYIKFYITILFLGCTINLGAQEVLTKEEAIEQALEHNYGIKIANNNLEIAKNNSSIYNTNYLPTLSSSAGTNYSNANQDIIQQSGSSIEVNGAETKSYNASLNLNYTLFDGLGRKYTYKQLKETQNLTELQVRETIETTYLDVFNLYYLVAQLSENTNNFQRALEISKTRLQRAQYQYEYGQNTRLEVLNAEVDVNNDSINYINIKQEYTNAKRNLNIVLGVNKDINYVVETDVDFIELFSLDELLIKTKDNNVILNQAEKNILISKYNIKVNKAGFYPRLGLNSSYNWNKNINPATSFLAESMSTGLSAGLNLSWNIFDGGTTKTRVANAKITLENQEILKDQQINVIENTLKNAWEDYNNKLFVFRAQEKIVITAENNFDRTQEKYKLGQVPSIEFRQSQINLINAQTALNVAKYDAKYKELEVLQIAGLLLNTQL